MSQVVAPVVPRGYQRGADREIHVARIIGRLVGGPSIQAISLTRELERYGYRTTLLRGVEADHEMSMDHVAQALGVRPIRIGAMRRDPGWRDLMALAALTRALRRDRPHIVHTHTAKAGSLGRVASMLVSGLGRRRPVRVHTFHGHALTGYFSPRTAAVYRSIERLLAKRTDKLIAVSEEVRDELVALGVAAPERFAVVPLGFDLAPFALAGAEREERRTATRARLAIASNEVVITLIGRLVPIKRVDRFLGACCALQDLAGVTFVVVGGGELGDSLQASAAARTLGRRLIWTGFRRDIPDICFASDVVALTSDNEGTPVSLIEASAAGLPTVSTSVGGASKVVLHGETGLLVPTADDRALASALRTLALDPELRARMGAAARAHATATFSLRRLIDDIDGLYRELLPGAGA